MCWRLVLADLLVAAAWEFAPAPIRWSGVPTTEFVLVFKAFPNRASVLPQTLMIWEHGKKSPSAIPNFVAKPDNTISWDSMGWCIEASGTNVGNEVRLNHCTGGPTQRWNRLPTGQGLEMIQLQDTNQCLDVADREGTFNGAPVELRECRNKATESWVFDSLSTGGLPHYASFWYSLSILKISVIFAVVLGALIVGFRLRRLNRKKRAMMVGQGGLSLPMAVRQTGVQDEFRHVVAAVMAMPKSKAAPPRPVMQFVAQPHPATLPVEQLQRDVEVKRTRGSGPGGQNRNKLETAIIAKHRPTDVVGFASEERSQARNQANALQRLRVKLAVSCRSDPPPVEPSELWKKRKSGTKVVVNEKHEDFPALLAEALDWIWADEDGVKYAASALGITTSQMVKFLAKEPAALEVVNNLRASSGLPKLKG